MTLKEFFQAMAKEAACRIRELLSEEKPPQDWFGKCRELIDFAEACENAANSSPKMTSPLIMEIAMAVLTKTGEAKKVEEKSLLNKLEIFILRERLAGRKDRLLKLCEEASEQLGLSFNPRMAEARVIGNLCSKLRTYGPEALLRGLDPQMATDILTATDDLSEEGLKRFLRGA